MSRKIEWNANHTNSQDQENDFIDKYLTWSYAKRWKYLLEIVSHKIKKEATNKNNRRIEWT